MVNRTTQAHNQAVSNIKIQGILAIVFGGLGVLISLLVMGIFGFILALSPDTDEVFGAAVMLVCALLFVLLPNVYLIMSGIALNRLPNPATTKVLTIINLVVGVFYNLVILVFAVITLTQLADYEQGYHGSKNES